MLICDECTTVATIETSKMKEDLGVDTSDTKDKLLDDEHCVTIEATETLSELTKSDIEIISKSSGRWLRTRLVEGEHLCIRKSYNYKKGDSVVIIDVTHKPWLKQLGLISDGDLVQFGDTIDVLRRHFIHVRCKNHITVVNGRKYCGKCKQIIFPRNMAYLSCLTNDILGYDKIVIGEMLVKNVDNRVLLIDMDISRREGNAL